MALEHNNVDCTTCTSKWNIKCPVQAKRDLASCSLQACTNQWYDNNILRPTVDHWMYYGDHISRSSISCTNIAEHFTHTNCVWCVTHTHTELYNDVKMLSV